MKDEKFFKVPVKEEGIEGTDYMEILDSYELNGRTFIVHHPHPSEGVSSVYGIYKVSDYQMGLCIPVYYQSIQEAKDISKMLLELDWNKLDFNKEILNPE